MAGRLICYHGSGSTTLAEAVMYLVQILIPLADNDGQPFGKDMFSNVQETLTQKFGGLTAYMQAPAKGIWQEGRSDKQVDQIVIFEVMVEQLDTNWWRDYRSTLEKSFRQEKMVIRAGPVTLL